MRRWRITYRDAGPGSPTFSGVWRGYDRDHATERFRDSDDDDDWVIVAITEITDDRWSMS